MDALIANQYDLIACLGFCADVGEASAAGKAAATEVMAGLRRRQQAAATSAGSSGSDIDGGCGSSVDAAALAMQAAAIADDQVQVTECVRSGAVSVLPVILQVWMSGTEQTAMIQRTSLARLPEAGQCVYLFSARPAIDSSVLADS